MRKKLTAAMLLSVFLLFSLLSAEDIETEPEAQIIPSIPQQAENLNVLWNLYASSGEITSLEHYAQAFAEFIDVETYSYENQAFLVSETAFYTMFARHYCRNYSSSMDDAVTSFAVFLNEQPALSPLSVYMMRLFSFLAQKTKSYIPVNETAVFNFSDADSSLQTLSSISSSTVTTELYKSYAAVEGMHQRFEKARLLHQSANAFNLSQDAYYRVFNNPSLVYVLLYDNRYSTLLSSFIRSASAYLEIDEQEVKSILLQTEGENLGVFPKNSFSLLYTKVPEEKKADKASLIYAVSDLLYELEQNSMLYGFPIDIFFTAGEFQLLLFINEDPFYLNCLNDKQLQSLVSSLVCASAAPLYIQRVNNLITALPSTGGF